MKKNYFFGCRSLLFGAAFWAFLMPFFAQKPAHFESNGGGSASFSNSECLSKTDLSEIEKRVTANLAALKNDGFLMENEAAAPPIFDWPLRKSVDFDYNSYYLITNFLDQNPLADSIRDYNCGVRTYDGHRGIDIALWPFPWKMVAQNSVEVVAAASGILVDKMDGFEDDHCACTGNWNYAMVMHTDGSFSIYGHMKTGSVTPKNIGSAIAAGEFLGIVASSGCSTGPHLHFEVYEDQPFSAATLIEPFSGNCNDFNAETWWLAPKNYREPTINTLLTHDAEPKHGCPSANEDPHLASVFAPGALGYFGAYYHDQLAGLATAYKIRRPNGSVWKQWSHASAEDFDGSWWWWSWFLPSSPLGVWAWEATFEGQSVSRPFTLGTNVRVDFLTDDLVAFQVSPNPTDGPFQVEIDLKNAVLDVQIDLFAADGRFEKRLFDGPLPIGKSVLNVENGGAGLHFLKIRTEKGTAVRRLFGF